MSATNMKYTIEANGRRFEIYSYPHDDAAALRWFKYVYGCIGVIVARELLQTVC